ncbi:MAG TPA: hypothetical protein DEW46_08960 [Verrucomicrobia bacterium]|jgi:beta-mannosidase|nr:hypothetical protein [Verrucomicrobiota bacterium]
MSIYMQQLTNGWQVCATWENECLLAQPLVRGGENLRSITPWIPARVPGTVQDDALAAGLLPDPFRERNSLACEWTAHRDWVYRRHFPIGSLPQGHSFRLCFRGIDDACVVYWDGRPLMRHEGPNEAFCTYIPNPGDTAREHWLHILVHSAPKEVGQLGRTTETHTRKMRFPYKWDFSTCLIPLGIWRPVTLEASRDGWFIDRPVVRTQYDWVSRSGHVGLETRLQLHPETDPPSSPIQPALTIEAPDQKERTEQKQHALSPGRFTFEHSLSRPELWFPHSIGASPLYRLELCCPAEEGNPLAGPWTPWHFQAELGFHNTTLEPNPGASDDALPYTVVVHQRPLPVCGANWVPADQFPGRVTPRRLDALLSMAQQAGINMVRVWGGGGMEQDAFYRTCSRLGILVWHDFFLSSSGIDNEPPRSKATLAALASEAEAVVREVSQHPCLALWCGGNELMDCGTFTPCTTQASPAIQLLEKVVSNLDPNRPFLPTTSSGPNFGLSLEALDGHQRLDDAHGPWTFQGPKDHFQLYNRSTALLHSEFGVEGPPELETLLEITTEANLWPPDATNPIWDFHAAWWNNRDRVEAVFGETASLSDYLVRAWHLQFAGLRYAAEANRRRRPHCSGSIIWQLNEPWPNACCTNLVDYYLRPKPGLYALKQAFAPVVASARLSAWYGTKPGQLPEISLYHDRFPDSPIPNHRLIATLFDLYGECLLSTELDLESHPTQQPIPFQCAATLPSSVCILRLQLPACGFVNDYLIGTAGPPPLSPLAGFDQADVHQEPQASGRFLLTNRSAIAAVGLHLSLPSRTPASPWPLLSDNHFCLLPGESRMISAAVTTEDNLHIQGLNLLPSNHE